MIGFRHDSRSPAWVSPRVIEYRPDQRGAVVAGLLLSCQVGDYQLEILACRDPGGIRMVGLAMKDGALAADLELELFGSSLIRPYHAVTTNAFGEFDIEAPHGEHWALRVGSDPYAPHVRLWDVLG